MSDKVGSDWSNEGRTGLRFFCPGCGNVHGVVVAGPGAWGYNGNREAPTFTPSVKVTMPPSDYCCHSFVTDGRIQFLSDCTHHLAGQTVDLPGWDEPKEAK